MKRFEINFTSDVDKVTDLVILRAQSHSDALKRFNEGLKKRLAYHYRVYMVNEAL